MQTLTVEEFRTKLKEQGVPTEHFAFKCPACGTVQSGHDLIKSNAGKDFDDIQKYLAFSCIGRFTHHKPPPPLREKGTQDGCNWTLGGFFQIHELVVVTEDGEKHPRFEIATPEEAKLHMEKNISLATSQPVK